MHAHTCHSGNVSVLLFSEFFFLCDCRRSFFMAVVIDDVTCVYQSVAFLSELVVRLCGLGRCSRRALTLSSEPPRQSMLSWLTACLDLRTGLPSRRSQRRTLRSGALHQKARCVCLGSLLHRDCCRLHFVLLWKKSSGAPAASPCHDWEPFFDRFGDMLP